MDVPSTATLVGVASRYKLPEFGWRAGALPPSCLVRSGKTRELHFGHRPRDEPGAEAGRAVRRSESVPFSSSALEIALDRQDHALALRAPEAKDKIERAQRSTLLS